LAVSLIEACFANRVGVEAGQQRATGEPNALPYFGESASQVLISGPHEAHSRITKVIENSGNGLVLEILGTVTTGEVNLMLDGQTIISGPIVSFSQVWSSALEANLHDNSANEVFA